jgi:hypothetical protein
VKSCVTTIRRVKRQPRWSFEERVYHWFLLIEWVGLRVAATQFRRKLGEGEESALKALVVSQPLIEFIEVGVHLRFGVVAVKSWMEVLIGLPKDGGVRLQVV